MQLKEAIKKRKAVVRYHHKKPDWRKIIRAIDMARYSPNADGRNVLKFILVSNKKSISELSEATQQSFVGTAQYLVVAVSDDSKLVRFYDERGVRYSSLQAGAAIQNFLLALTELKLVTKWVKHFSDVDVKRILKISDELSVEGIFPIGIETKVRSPEEKRKDLENTIFFDKWGNKKMARETRVSVDNS